MKSKPKKIYIANFLYMSGGALVISTLCATLRELGYDARLVIRDYPIRGISIGWRRVHNYIFKTTYLILLKLSLLPKKYRKDHPTSVDVTGLTEKLKFKYVTPFNKKDSIVIYPETIWGNPLGIKNVVRWMLFHPSYHQGVDTYSENDCFVAFREVFNDEKLNPQKDTLLLNYFDSTLYRQYNFGHREGNCYIIRKGKFRKDLPKEFDGPVFNDDISDEEFVKILNKCKYCYSYDTQTFYNSIAAVCGCIPIVVLEPGKTEADYLSPGEKHYGVAFGNTPEQINHAISTRDLLLKRLDYTESNRENTKKFVEYLKSKFGELKTI